MSFKGPRVEPLTGWHLLNEARSSALRNLVEHLVQAGDEARLFRLLEKKSYLARQAAELGSFNQGLLDLENHVLAVAIKTSDWPRFLRFFIITCNLHGLIGALADETILRSLVRHGQYEYAASTAGQLPDPLARAGARAIVLGCEKLSLGNRQVTGARYRHELQLIVEDLARTDSPLDEASAAALCKTLCVIARELGTDVHHSYWVSWVKLLSSWSIHVHQVWLAVAESWLAYDVSPTSFLWQALRALPRHSLLSYLPSRIEKLPPAAVVELEATLVSLFTDDKELHWHVRIAVLAGQIAHEQKPYSVDAELGDPSVQWSPELIQSGLKLWPCLGLDQLERLAMVIEDPVARVALRMCWLRKAHDSELSARVASDLEQISEPTCRLHWTLQLISVQPEVRRTRRSLDAVAGCLEDLRYEVPGSDLALFLDQVARLRPRRLRIYLENIVWSPYCSAAILLELASAAGELVSRNLLNNTERYANTVSNLPAEAFVLRFELIQTITCRLVVEQGDPSVIEHVRPMLLPVEEDRLRAAVVEALAVKTGHNVDADIWQGIDCPRLRLLSELRAASANCCLDTDLSPGALYEALSNIDIANDELHSLAPLLASPGEPDSVHEHLSEVHDPLRRAEALIDLTLRKLEHHQQTHGRRVPDALQPLARAAGALPSDEVLVRLTPALAVLGARANPGHALLEMQQAVLKILDLDTVELAIRLEALEELIKRIASDNQIGLTERNRSRFFLWLARYATRWRATDFDRVWSCLLPIVWAGAVMLDRRWDKESREAGKRSIFSKLFSKPSLVSSLEYTLSGGLLGHLPITRSITVDTIKRHLSEGQQQALMACRQGVKALHAHAIHVLGRSDRQIFDVLETLIYLLCPSGPEHVPQLLGCIADDELRNALCLRLIRNHWLPAQQAAKVIQQISNARIADTARLWLTIEEYPELSIKALASLVGSYGSETLSPYLHTVRQALWQVSPENACAELAEAARSRLASNDWEAVEQSLRLWLQAYLNPCWCDTTQRFTAAEKAVQDACTL